MAIEQVLGEKRKEFTVGMDGGSRRENFTRCFKKSQKKKTVLKNTYKIFKQA
jgi:hypothetical protein